MWGLAASPGAAQSALATRVMLAIFRSMAHKLWALAALPPVTSLILTTSPEVDASVETALPAKWNGETRAGKGIACRPSVKFRTQKIQVWIANAMMASRARSHGMAPMQQAPAFRQGAISTTPIESRALAASVSMALMEILPGRETSPRDHANLLNVASKIPPEKQD